MANRTATPARTHREEDLSHAERIRHADDEMRRVLRMIKAMIDVAAKTGNLEIPGDVQLDERDGAIAEEVWQNRLLLLVVGDVIEKRLAEPGDRAADVADLASFVVRSITSRRKAWEEPGGRERLAALEATEQQTKDRSAFRWLAPSPYPRMSPKELADWLSAKEAEDLSFDVECPCCRSAFLRGKEIARHLENPDQGANQRDVGSCDRELWGALLYDDDVTPGDARRCGYVELHPFEATLAARIEKLEDQVAELKWDLDKVREHSSS